MDAFINGISYYVPENKLSNSEISILYPEWSVDKISKKTGIFSRHIAAKEEFTSDMAISALNKLVVDFELDKSEIDYLILCTQSPDYSLPTTACIVQDRAGLSKTCGAIDINLGCSGYVYGLGLAKGLVSSEQAVNVVFITSETYSKLLHPEDKSNRTIFGDAATATLITSKPNLKYYSALIKKFKYGTDGSGYDKLIVKNSGAKSDTIQHDSVYGDEGDFVSNDNFLYMNGREIFNFTAFEVPKLVEATLVENSITMLDVAKVVFHQANAYMLDFIRKRCKIPEEIFYVSMEDVGNTVSSTIPIALRRLIDENNLKEGDKLLLSGFGVGLSMGGVIIETRSINK